MIGSVYSTATSPTELKVSLLDWDPVIGDMFFVAGMPCFNPASGSMISALDARLTVLETPQKSDDGLATLQVYPRMLINGPYRNVEAFPAKGAELYRPAGEFLKEIWRWWLETNR